MCRRLYSHPRGRGEALEHVLAKLLGGEVTVFEQRAGLNLEVSDRAKFLYQCTERMERADRLQESRMFRQRDQ
jgi:hypothetical protein